MVMTAMKFQKRTFNNSRSSYNSSAQHNIAEEMRRHSGLSRHVCQQILNAANRNDYRRLGIEAEKHLMTGEQSEGMKERGLTVFDVVTGEYEIYDSGFADGTKEEWNERLGQSIFKFGVS